MNKKALIVVVAMLMISSLFVPAHTWVYPDKSQDSLYEVWGPRAEWLVINLYANHNAEMTAIDNHDIDIADDTLTLPDIAYFSPRPDVNMYSYGTGVKIMSKWYVGPEAGYTGEDWYGVVNEAGYGIDSEYSFLNMHTSCHEFGGTIRYGFSTPIISSLNPLYASTSWDNKVLDLIGYESLLAKDPYSPGTLIPWVAKAYSIGTYVNAALGTCSKVAFTLRNDVYWSDGTQVSIADVMFTFVECNKLLAARTFPPPTWWGNVANVLDFKIYDPLNFEVLFNSVISNAGELVGLNRILPKHIWKPICQGVTAPKSGSAWLPNTFAPDPDLIASGPWRLVSYTPFTQIVLQAHTPGTYFTGLTCLDPNANPSSIVSPKGYFKLKPKYADIDANTHNARVDPIYPNTAVWVNIVVTDHNLKLEEFEFLFAGDGTAPVGGTLTLIWPINMGCLWTITGWIDDNPNGVLDAGDMVQAFPVAPPGPGPIWLYIHSVAGPVLRVGQVIEADKRVYVDGGLIAGPIHEYEKPCIPITETFPVILTKCMHTVRVEKDITTQWFLAPNNELVPNPYYGSTVVVAEWPIWITIPEDIIGSYYVNTQLLAPDCKVELRDLMCAGLAYGTYPGYVGPRHWSPYADINNDYKIDLKDWFPIAKKFGKW